MSNSSPSPPAIPLEFKLAVKSREASGCLVPEQSAFFDLTLTNAGKAAAQVFSLNGNPSTPVYRVLEQSGSVRLEVSPRSLMSRFAGEMGESVPMPPQLMEIAPGAAKATWFDLWSFTSPFPRGRYQVEVLHQMVPSEPARITSNRASFQIEDAKVAAAACGYEASDHRTSMLAWSAEPVTGGGHRLLMRLSTVNNHAAAQRSGFPLGPIPGQARLALGEKAPGGSTESAGWLAVVAGTQAELILQFRAQPLWRSRPVPLPVSDPVPLQQFPDRDRALFLAVGTTAPGKFALTGFVLAPPEEEENGPVDKPPPKPWLIPLQTAPRQTLCVAGPTGPVAVLFLSEEGRSTRLSLLQVNEDGSVASPELGVYSTENAILAMAADPRTDARAPFVAVEQSRSQADQLAVLEIPRKGAVAKPTLSPAKGWPALGPEDHQVPQPAVSAALEITPLGGRWLVVCDGQGGVYGGDFHGDSLQLSLRGTPGPGLRHLHIAAFPGFLGIAGFDQSGALHHVGGSSGPSCH